MSYTALYRVWRPGRFSEVVGQSHISQTLKNAILRKRVSHAYLFAGPRGTGKTSLAKIMGKAVNCLDLQEGEPCNKCLNCQAINEGSFMDYFEIDAASNRGIDEIREMREKVKFAPSQGRTKVYVIDEVHMLTNEAFNALLKTLEEPPEHVIFILATTEPQKIPLTILSRCQRYDFKKIHEEGIKERLQEIIEAEKITVENTALDLIIRKAEGGMRDAISILDQGLSASENNQISLSEIEKVLGTLNSYQLRNIFEQVFTGDIEKTLGSLDSYLSEGKEVKQIVKDMVDYLRQIIIYKASGESQLVSSYFAEIKDIADLGKMKKMSELNQMLQELIDSEQKMYYFSRPRIILESLLIDFIAKAPEAIKTPGAMEEKAKILKERPSEMTRDILPQKENLAKKEIEIPEINSIWEQVLIQVKREKIVLHACLIEGEFCLEDGQGKIMFQENKKFHQERVGKQENIALLEKILCQKLKQEIKVASVLKGNPSPEPEQEIKNEKKETLNEKGTDIIDEALRIFNAELVEIKK